MDVFCAPVEYEFGEVWMGSDASKVLCDFFEGGGAAGGKKVGSDTYAAVTSWAAR